MKRKQRTAKWKAAKHHRAVQAEKKRSGVQPVHKRKQLKKPKES